MTAPRERIMQQERKKTALEAKKDGKKVFIKYKKPIIDEVEWLWNEKDMKLFRKEGRKDIKREEQVVVFWWE